MSKVIVVTGNYITAIIVSCLWLQICYISSNEQ